MRCTENENRIRNASSAPVCNTRLPSGPGLWRQRRHRHHLGGDCQRYRRGNVIDGDSRSRHRESFCGWILHGNKQCPLDTVCPDVRDTASVVGCITQRRCDFCSLRRCRSSAALRLFVSIRRRSSLPSGVWVRRDGSVRNRCLSIPVFGPNMVAWRIGDVGAWYDGEHRRLRHRRVCRGIRWWISVSRRLDLADGSCAARRCAAVISHRLVPRPQAKEPFIRRREHPLRCQEAAKKAPGRCPRTTTTGIRLWVSTLTVSLPSTIAETPRRPCEAMTTASHPNFFAVLMIASCG